MILDRESTNGKRQAMFDAAVRYTRASLSVVPNGLRLKAPSVSEWTSFQSRIASEDELRGWFLKARKDAIGIVCGAVSGNLEVLDFDFQAIAFERWRELVEAERPGLVARLVIEKSQSGGRHVPVRLNRGRGRPGLSWPIAGPMDHRPDCWELFEDVKAPELAIGAIPVAVARLRPPRMPQDARGRLESTHFHSAEARNALQRRYRVWRTDGSFPKSGLLAGFRCRVAFSQS